MELYEINLFERENTKKIRVKGYEWSDLLLNKEILFSVIGDLIFSNENLLYYVSQKEYTKTLEETRRYIIKLIEQKIIDKNVAQIFDTIGWNSKTLNIDNTVFQGDLAEYLMSILIDKITDISTLISKVSLKTASGMPAYGNDNIYYDYENEVLYYGESKFYSDIDRAIERAIASIGEHSGEQEFSYICTHTGVFIADNAPKREEIVEKLDTKSFDEVIIKSIIFIINDDIYERKDIEEKIKEHFKDKDGIVPDEIIMIFLPILSKKEFLEYFKGRLLTNE